MKSMSLSGGLGLGSMMRKLLIVDLNRSREGGYS